MDNSTDDELNYSAAKELFERYKTLAGGAEECKKIFAWMEANPTLEEVVAHSHKCNHLHSALHLETLFGKIIRRYEKENGLERRILGNDEIDVIIDHGRLIRAIKEDGNDQIKYAFTVGNSTHSPPDPELITFYPGQKICSYILNYLSDLFASEIIKPLLGDEAREVIGVLGKQGQMPVRVRLLSGAERKSACDKWNIYVPYDEAYPLILVDIPDTNGYYGWEEECMPYLREIYPQEMASPPITSTQFLPDKQDQYPVSADAAYVCFRALNEVVKNANIDAGKELSHATWITLLNIEDWCNPATWADDDDDQLIQDAFALLSHCSYIRGAKEWVLDQLNERDHDPYDIAYEWALPKPKEEPVIPDLGEREFEEFFSGKEALLTDIDWSVIAHVATEALKYCIDKEKVDELRGICNQIDSDSGD